MKNFFHRPFVVLVCSDAINSWYKIEAVYCTSVLLFDFQF